MRNELVANSDFADPEKAKVLDVLNKSRETALQRYEHPIYDTELGLGSIGWYKPLMRTPAQFTPQQFSVFKAVHKWRDTVGREEDESPNFIMPNHAIFSLARALPQDKATLFNVTQHVSPVLRLRADELVAVITKAKTEDGPDMNDTIKKISDLRFAEKQQAGTIGTATTDTRQTVATKPAPLLETLNTPPLRASVSKFWGPLLRDAVEQRRQMSMLDVSLALPLPPLTAEIFADNSGFVTQDATPKAEKPELAFVPKKDRVPEDQRTDIFIVKQLGGGRKRTHAEATAESSVSTPISKDVATEDGGEVEADEINLEEDANALLKKEKALKKKQRKQRKKEKLAARGIPDTAEALDNKEEEPIFDYATAPSVLKAADAEREAGKKRKDKKGKKKDPNFNPYAKLNDAPKGLPRSQKEGPGRSKTFSS